MKAPKRSKRSTPALNGDNSDRQEKEELIPELVSFVVFCCTIICPGAFRKVMFLIRP